MVAVAATAVVSRMAVIPGAVPGWWPTQRSASVAMALAAAVAHLMEASTLRLCDLVDGPQVLILSSVSDAFACHASSHSSHAVMSAAVTLCAFALSVSSGRLATRLARTILLSCGTRWEHQGVGEMDRKRNRCSLFIREVTDHWPKAPLTVQSEPLPQYVLYGVARRAREGGTGPRSKPQAKQSKESGREITRPLSLGEEDEERVRVRL